MNTIEKIQAVTLIGRRNGSPPLIMSFSLKMQVPFFLFFV